MYQLAADSHRDDGEDLEECWSRSDVRPHRPHGWRDRPASPRLGGLEPDFRFLPSRRSIFDGLVAQWREDATYESMTHRVAMLAPYQNMIGMGRAALPLILERLTTDPSPHWFWALRAIAHEDPAAGKTTVPDAVTLWLEWGQSKGYVPG